MDKVIANIYETYDYSKFKFIKGNRNVDHAEIIAKSMDEKFLLCPICVNEKFEIVDGQNRFVACKMRGLPIQYYICHGYTSKDVNIFNRCSKNWIIKDYIELYASEGKKDYIDFRNFQLSHPTLSTKIIKYLLQGSLAEPNLRGIDKLKGGSFQIKDLADAERVAKMIESYSEFNDDYFKHNQNPFATAIIKLSKFKKFDNETALHKIRLNRPLFKKCANSVTYIEQFETILNYKRKGEKIHFDFDNKSNPIQ